MIFSIRKVMLCSLAMLMTFAITASAQWQKKPYTEWSEKDADAVLNNSPWAQTQAVTDTSRMFDRGRRQDSGQSRVAEVTRINFRIRFFSAKPVRQAVSRIIEIQQKGELNDQFAAQLKALAESDFPDYIIVTVVTDVSDSGSQLAQAVNLLAKQTTAELKNETYLLLKTGQRLFLQEYQPPRRDGLGARFIFPRIVDGKPFIDPDSGEVTFRSQLIGGPELSMRFKVKDMMFNGKLEY